MADYFEEAAKLSNQPKTVSNWMMGELMRLLNADGKEIEDSPIKPDRLAGLIKMIEQRRHQHQDRQDRVRGDVQER